MSSERVNALPIILFWFFFDVVLVMIVLWVLVFFKLIEIKKSSPLAFIVDNPVSRMALGEDKGPQLSPDDLFLLSSLRIKKREEALDSRFSDLNTQVVKVERSKQEVLVQSSQLEKDKQEILDKENTLTTKLDKIYNRENALTVTSNNLTKMPPQKAADILLSHTDQDIIDILRITEEQATANGKASLVSVWMGLMPPQRVADIQRKMTVRPKDEEGL